jgi:polysaccharide biosynthesis/export protein
MITQGYLGSFSGARPCNFEYYRPSLVGEPGWMSSRQVNSLVAFGRALRFLAILTFVIGAPALAQTPSAEQLQIFQNLTPEQQDAILERVTGAQQGSSTVPGATSNRSSNQTGESRQDALRRGALSTKDSETLNPVLKADDTVIVEVSLPPTAEAKAAEDKKEASQAASQNAQPGAKPPESPSVLRRGRTLADVSPEEQTRLQKIIDLILSRNPYTLDRSAQLNLPGFAPIALSGLTEVQATRRLSVEPELLQLDVRIVRLPLVKAGSAGLKPFGYDLFEDAPSTFSPVTDVPVPADYVVGPGDEFTVQLYGSQNRTQRFVVSREGFVSFPELGPVRVAGMTFDAVRSRIEERVAQQMIGVRASVSMGGIRSVRVFVLGEARQPGSYTVSGLATMTTALFASGGVKPIGSLRDIQLKRQGAVVRHFDLYDLLIRGDTSSDSKLQPGDVIFIPPVGPTVSIDGEVRRPAIYELRGDTNTAGLLQLAGGLTPDADSKRSSITRVDEQFRRVVLGVDFSSAEGRSQMLRNGDALRVARLRPQLDSGVMLEGFVHRPGPVAWHTGMRLSEVIGSIDELKPDADAHYILIRRESGGDRKVDVLSADLVAALTAPGSTADVALMPRDRVIVFELAPGRERVIRPILDELRLQSGLDRPTELVRVEGQVRVPGEYPLEPGMKVSDLLRAGGNLDSAAYGGKAELARYEVTNDGSRQTGLIEVDLAAVLRGDAAANIPLRPFDYLLIKETPNWTDQQSVTLRGEVRFPGTYPIRRGETLYQLLQRAGGLTSQGFAKGSAFTRVELKQREQKALEVLKGRMQADLASLALQAANANQAGASQALASGQSLLGQLENSQAVGRLVIDLPGLLAEGAGSPKDVVLRDGDTLIVPLQKQEVTVVGEVQSATSHLYATNLDRDDYVGLSGGATQKADEKRTYIVRADGSVVGSDRSMFSRSHNVAIQPGDTIVVPYDTERMPKLPMWQAITTIMYNLAIAVAAVNAL